jgi:DNA-binding response OmpR family regulator
MQSPTVVVVEDDPTNRILISQILRKHDFEVLPAANGALALDLIRELMPDVVVTDIQMPEMDGVELLKALRADPQTVTLPVLMLTSLAERNNMRESMAAGADDYITKPFTPQELVDAVRAQMSKRQKHLQANAKLTKHAVESALADQRHEIAGVYERRLKKELAEAVWNQNIPPPTDTSFEDASLLYADLMHRDWNQHLSPADLVEALKVSYSNATDTLSLFGAQAVQIVGEGLLAVFAPVNDTHTVRHQLRAVRSAFALTSATDRVGQHLKAKFPGQNWRPFEVAVALHSGPVALANLTTFETAANVQGLPVGETVREVIALHAQAIANRCRVLASEVAIMGMENSVTLGRRGAAPIPSSGKRLVVAEIVGWRHPSRSKQPW